MEVNEVFEKVKTLFEEELGIDSEKINSQMLGLLVKQ